MVIQTLALVEVQAVLAVVVAVCDEKKKVRYGLQALVVDQDTVQEELLDMEQEHYYVLVWVEVEGLFAVLV